MIGFLVGVAMSVYLIGLCLIAFVACIGRTAFFEGFVLSVFWPIVMPILWIRSWFHNIQHKE